MCRRASRLAGVLAGVAFALLFVALARAAALVLRERIGMLQGTGLALAALAVILVLGG